ncbi:CoA transferase [soil metagenome]
MWRARSARPVGGFRAEVIRVERIDGAEDRGITPLAGDNGDAGAMFVQLNRNKRGMTLNPTKPRGREVTRRLLATADVVVANLPGQALTAMGLDAAAVHDVNPDIVLATTDAFGPGPWVDRLGFDGVGQVMSGAAHLSGPPDQPAKTVALWVDHLTGALSAFGIVTALLQRHTTGAGDHVQTALLHSALLHSALTVMAGSLAEQAVVQPDRVGSDNRAQTVGPADIIATADGWVIVQIVGDGLFARLAGMLGRPEWVDDPRFASDLSRGDHRDQLVALITPWCAERTTEEVLAAFNTAGVPSGPVLSPQQVLEHAHVASSPMIAPATYPGVSGSFPLVTSPVRLGNTTSPAGPTARLGADTDAILTELGYDPAAIATLHQDRIV